jgi:transcriptional regulator with GAF, ATPase, and Fis domain
LLDEIRRYKTEIEQMKAATGDTRPFLPSSQDATAERSDFHGILYYSNGPMAKAVDFIKKIADTNAVVLVQGESGTGKELVANAIHRQSQRKEKSFIAINCGALSESLLESELFGHERGAFTGAMREKPGRFELADGGTIFLDEIGETSEAFQVKLLRVLQDGTFERVGGTETRKVDARVVAATNRDLKQQVALKRFREDLFYRVNVFAIQLPPLRDRKDDIPLLIDSFISAEQPGMSCSQSAVDALVRHEWRGNIRELQSAIKRAVVLAVAEGRQMLRLKDFSDEVIAAGLEKDNLEDRIIASLREKEFSRSAISETAEDLGGLNRGTVAEYFRGYVFKVFAESRWSLEHTVETIAGVRDYTIRGRVQKKASEYLANAIQYVDSSRSFDEVTSLSKPKYKNLPQRYHVYLDQLISSAYKGAWTIDPHSFNNDSPERLN